MQAAAVPGARCQGPQLFFEVMKPGEFGSGCYCPAQICDAASLDGGDTNDPMSECLGSTVLSDARLGSQSEAQSVAPQSEVEMI